MMKKLTGFITLWVVLFSILWILDENGLFSYRTIEIFFGEELSLPQEYSTKKVDIAKLGQRSYKKESSASVEEKAPQMKRQQPANNPKQQVTNRKLRTTKKSPRVTNKKSVENNSPQKKLPKKQEPQQVAESQIPDHILPLYKRGEFYSCLHEVSRHQHTVGNNEALNNLARKCQNLGLLVNDLKRKTKLQGSVTVVRMSNGKEYVGKIVEDRGGSVKIQNEWGTLPLPKSRILKRINLSGEEYRSQMSKKYKARINDLKANDYSAVMTFITETYENNMPHLIARAVDKLERRNRNLLREIIEFKASKIFQSYLWCRTMGQKQRAQKFRNQILDKYSQTVAARKVRSEAVKDVPVGMAKDEAPAEKPKAMPKIRGQAAKIVQKANKYYGVAFKHLKKSFPGEPNADRELAKAKENFQKACKYYQEALSLQPNNTNLQKQLQQSMEYYHHCIKQTRLE